MNRYAEQKEKLRNFALDWQCNFAEQDYSWGELAYWCDYFETMGKRYGLLQEFHENGIL